MKQSKSYVRNRVTDLGGDMQKGAGFAMAEAALEVFAERWGLLTPTVDMHP